jgi:hypothetical protein
VCGWQARVCGAASSDDLARAYRVCQEGRVQSPAFLLYPLVPGMPMSSRLQPASCPHDRRVAARRVLALAMAAATCAVLVAVFGPPVGRNPASRRGPRAEGGRSARFHIALRTGLAPETRLSANLQDGDLASALLMYGELTGRTCLPNTNPPLERLDDFLGRRLSRWRLIRRPPPADSGIRYHGDGRFSAQEMQERLETVLSAAGLTLAPVGERYLRIERVAQPARSPPEGH